jgi:predicted solute-binding protein
MMMEHLVYSGGDTNLGAVNYLNMLPYFAFAPQISRTATPREMNAMAREGRVSAACISAIAGLAGGLEPSIPFIGVGAEHKVESVFLEPIIPAGAGAAAMVEFWSGVRSRNFGGLRQLGMRDTAAVDAQRSRVRILTSGASEQSEWLFRMLLAAQGIASSVERTPSTLQHSDVAAWVAHRETPTGDTEGTPTALLMIGDPALHRRLAVPTEALVGGRIDLAEFWRDFADLPCIFAVWFVAAGAPRDVDIGPARASLAAWHRASDTLRWAKITDFTLATAAAPESILCVANYRERVLSYFRGLVYDFDDRYRRSYAAYRRLSELFGVPDARAAPRCLSPLSGASLTS